MSEKLKEVCAYIRVSTDKQEELSPESQIRPVSYTHLTLPTKLEV